MDVDTSDILGQQTYPKVKEDFAGRSGLSFTTSAFVLAGLLAAYVLGIQIWERVLVWRERSYKLSMRRRYGIPDNDHRPFNVAYADVVQARRNNEAVKRPPPAPAVSTDRVAAPSEQTIRQRPCISRFSTYSQASGASDRYNLGTSGAPNAPLTYETSPKKSGPARRFSRKNLDVNGDVDVKKRGLDEQEECEDVEHDSKKTKVEGDELIDGDEDAEWEDERNGYVPIRGSKRGLGEEDESDFIQSECSRDKRARKVSLEKTPQTFMYDYDGMDVDADEAGDEVPDLQASSNRGKKRDRAEAGSTFGGDDEESAPEHDEEDAKSRRRRRKRRTVSKRKSDAASNARGKKRDRDVEDSGSDMENEGEIALRSSRKKRGKRGSLAASRLDEETRSDNESLASSKSRGRRIGDEWESNGIKWKIGPNGQRLRQALVKKARQKFVMPKDSQHPDREANLEVFVETWLTEEEYEDAKSQHLLAWQDSPKASTEPEALTVDTVATGKNLLWNSTTGTPAGSPIGLSPAQTGPIGIPTGRQLMTRDFSGLLASKRIAAATGTPRGNLNDSTNGSPRWEKQELEARAMNKIQEKMRAQKEQLERERALKERLEKEKAEKERKDREAATEAKPPAITITPVAKPSPFSFGKTANAEPHKTPSTAAASKPSLFNAPLGSIPFAAPSESTVKPVEKPAVPSFGFPSSTPSASSTASTSAMPNFFSKPPAPVQSATASAPAASPFGQPSAASTSNDTKKSTFPFGNSASTTTPATAPTSNLNTKPVFSFSAATQPADNAPGSTALSGHSLLARIGAPNPSNISAEQSKAAPVAQQSQSSFSFSKPDAAKSSSPFGAPSSTTLPQSGSSTTAPPASGPPAGTTTAAPTPSSSLNGALGGGITGTSGSSAFKPTPSSAEANKDSSSSTPAPLKFSFAAPSSSTATATESKDVSSTTPSFTTADMTTGSTSSAPAPPKFGFPTSTGGGFGAKPTTTNNTEAPKPNFSLAPPSTNTATGGSSAFGATGFGGSSNVFGGGAFGGSSASKPADKSSPFAFAAPSSSSSNAEASNALSGNALPSTSTANAPAASGAANATSSPFSFKFGEPKPVSTTPFGTPTTGSMFGGNTTGPSAFGFRAPSTNNATSVFGAGASGTSGEQQQQQK
ncbi:hypothetical protein BDQ17DRAFT_1352230 [Cyathus striatus]|nr:hypothetical protein BDQ17DRAFT_1352230 [Cyathus striatus]